jgi:hypothetical protein
VLRPIREARQRKASSSNFAFSTQLGDPLNDDICMNTNERSSKIHRCIKNPQTHHIMPYKNVWRFVVSSHNFSCNVERPSECDHQSLLLALPCKTLVVPAARPLHPTCRRHLSIQQDRRPYVTHKQTKMISPQPPSAIALPVSLSETSVPSQKEMQSVTCLAYESNLRSHASQIEPYSGCKTVLNALPLGH